MRGKTYRGLMMRLHKLFAGVTLGGKRALCSARLCSLGCLGSFGAE